MIEKFNLVLEKKGIEKIGEINFNNDNQIITFLNKLDELLNKEVKINFLNNDFKDIILQSDFSNEKIFQTFKDIELQTFFNLVKDRSDKRKEEVYQNFLTFIKDELGIEKYESIFKKKENYDIELDMIKKIRKYKVDVVFDYKNLGQKSTINNFILYFNKRYDYFFDILKSQIDEEKLYKISKLKEPGIKNSKIKVECFGLVDEINETKNKHIIFTIEDKNSKIKCLINSNKLNKSSNMFDLELKQKIESLCLDEGVVVKGSLGDDIIFVDDIILSSKENILNLKTIQKDEYVAFLSDFHVGSKVFVDVDFQKMIDFLCSKTQSKKLNEIAKKIKYIIINGDFIEGIGVYPNQEKDIAISSTELQYKRIAKYLNQIPKDKCILSIAGNHDVARLAEPQTRIKYEKAYPLYNMENFICFSNPCSFNLYKDEKNSGLNFFLYHGGSLFYYADKIKFLREGGGARIPNKVGEFLLEKKHLSPSHGSNVYIPDSEIDPLKIIENPDFFILGHTHKMAITKNYKGCSIISCACWSELTDNQEKLGMYPDVGKLILTNIKTRKIEILNFRKEEK